MSRNETMCKVDSLTERYELSSPDPGHKTLDEYLLARWTGADETKSEGYQTLTHRFNQQLLSRLYEQHGRDATNTRLESEYNVLRGEKDLKYEEIAADLTSDGIDAETVRETLISWSTMRRHLQNCLDGEKTHSSSTTEWELNSVALARERTKEKVSAALRSFVSKQRLPEADKADIDIQIKLSCPECPTRVPLEDALERGYICRDHFQIADPLSTDFAEITKGDRTGALALALTPMVLLMAEWIICDAPHLMINVVGALVLLFT